MAFSKKCGRLFSVSDDGKLVVNDLNEGKIVGEWEQHSNKYPLFKN